MNDDDYDYENPNPRKVVKYDTFRIFSCERSLVCKRYNPGSGMCVLTLPDVETNRTIPVKSYCDIDSECHQFYFDSFIDFVKESKKSKKSD